jgi:hypothetical protein
MKLIEVSSKRDLKKFIQFPVQLYKSEKNWIRPLDKEIENVFRPEKNIYFESGDCISWILERKGVIVGRISAFFDTRKINRDFNQPTGGVGFFECIDDQEAANLLFNTAKSWLIANNMEAMDGPVNFGDRNKWWGLLTKGYDIEPSYQCNYHLPYYTNLFENFGFEVYFNQFTFTRKIEDPLHPRLFYKAKLIAENPDYTFVHLNMKTSKQQVLDIIEIYNKAWKSHKGVPKITHEQGKEIFNKLKLIVDERIIWLAYYKNEPAAFYFNIPDVNGILKYLNGKLGVLGKLKFLWYKNTIKKKKMLGVVFGVVPEHQGTGLDGALIISASKIIQNLGDTYPILEINGVGDFNRKMVVVVKQVGGEICKVHTTYRYLFDRTKSFKRMDFI